MVSQAVGDSVITTYCLTLLELGFLFRSNLDGMNNEYDSNTVFGPAD